jgi:hypothetical protein
MLLRGEQRTLCGQRGGIAQRTARVIASPSGRSANRSVTGKYGNCKCRRDHLGSVEIVAAASNE